MKVKNPGLLEKYLRQTFLALFVLISWSFHTAFSGKLTPEQLRGKAIYEQGVSLSGSPVTARMSGVEVPAKVLPCASCHGLDGAGKPEGGVHPSNLTWPVLSRSHTVQKLTGRTRKAYNEQLLANAIRSGIDASGNELQETMPRYTITGSDLADLVAYLKVLGQVDDPGMTDDLLRLGIILPPREDFPGKGKAVLSVAEAYLDLVNAAGGIYNRRIELKAFEVEDPGRDYQEAFGRFIDEEDLFAFTASTLGSFTGMEKLIAARKLPVIGAISGNPSSNTINNGNIFYLFPGLEQELKALLDHIIDEIAAKNKRLTVLYTDRPGENEAVDLLDQLMKVEEKIQMNRIVIPSAQKISIADLEQMKASGNEALLLLDNVQWQTEFFEKAAALDWYPQVLIPGKFASPDLLNIPKGFQGKIHISYPTWVNQRNDKALQWYAQLAEAYRLPEEHLHTQLHTLAAVILFTESLKIAGKDLSRSKLITEIERLRGFQTGYTPALTYGLNKRIGSEKVFIVSPDLEKQRLVLTGE